MRAPRQHVIAVPRTPRGPRRRRIAPARFASLVALVSLSTLGAAVTVSSSARAQVNLPPPPPPPLSTSNPPPPPPPSSGSADGSNGSGNGGSGGGKGHGHGADTHHHTAPPPGASTTHEDVHEHEAPEPAAPTARHLTVRGNPLPVFLLRVSVDIEYELAPHHAIVASPHITLKNHRATLPARGFGYTSDDTSGVGAEVGYHYWVAPRMEGVFLGPSLVLGVSLPPAPISTYAYYGLAFDVGYQLVLPSGFTLAAGGGLLLIGAGGGNALHAAPRLLLGLGWSF